MLELTETQLTTLRQREHADFVERVQTEIVEKFPEFAAVEGLSARLNAAHGQALKWGLESGKSRTQFLYQEAFAPGFYKAPAIEAWINRPGAPAEQRWRDFMALVQSRLMPHQDGED